MAAAAPIIGALTGGGIGSIIARAALSLAVSFITNKLFAPELPEAQGGDSAQSPDQGVKQRIATDTSNKLPVVYGEARVFGSITFADITSDNQTMAFIIPLCEGPVNSIGDIYWDNFVLSLDATGNVTNALDDNGNSDDFLNNNLKIIKAPTGGRSTEMETFSSKWLNNADKRTMPNVAYLYAELKYNRDKNVTGLTSKLGAIVQGRTVRAIEAGGVFAASETYSTNPAECLADYLTNSTYGCGGTIKDTDLDLTTFVSHKTFCNEAVNFTESDGTTTSGSRYTSNGVINTNDTRDIIISDLTSNSQAVFGYSIGKFQVVSDKEETITTDTLEFTDDNIYGDVSIVNDGFNSALNRFNISFNSKDNLYQDDQTFISLPSSLKSYNEPELIQDTRFKFINNNVMAERAGNVIIRKSRDSLIVSFKTDARALALQVNDVVKVTNSTYGFTDKLFRVNSITETQIGNSEDGILGFYITAQEYNLSAYTDQALTAFSPASNTDLPNPRAIGQINNISLVATNTTDTPPSVDISFPVPTGIIESFDVFYSTSSSTLLSGLTLAQTIESPTGTYTENDIVSEKIFNIPATTELYIWVRGANQFAKGPVGSPLDVGAWQPASAGGTIQTENGVTYSTDSNQPDFLTNQFMQIQYGNDSSGSGIRNDFTADKEKQSAGHSALTTEPNSLEITGTPISHEMTVSVPNNFSGGISTPETQEITLSGTRPNVLVAETLKIGIPSNPGGLSFIREQSFGRRVFIADRTTSLQSDGYNVSQFQPDNDIALSNSSEVKEIKNGVGVVVGDIDTLAAQDPNPPIPTGTEQLFVGGSGNGDGWYSVGNGYVIASYFIATNNIGSASQGGFYVFKLNTTTGQFEYHTRYDDTDSRVYSNLGTYYGGTAYSFSDSTFLSNGNFLTVEGQDGGTGSTNQRKLHCWNLSSEGVITYGHLVYTATEQITTIRTDGIDQVLIGDIYISGSTGNSSVSGNHIFKGFRIADNGLTSTNFYTRTFTGRNQDPNSTPGGNYRQPIYAACSTNVIIMIDQFSQDIWLTNSTGTGNWNNAQVNPQSSSIYIQSGRLLNITLAPNGTQMAWSVGDTPSISAPFNGNNFRLLLEKFNTDPGVEAGNNVSIDNPGSGDINLIDFTDAPFTEAENGYATNMQISNVYLYQDSKVEDGFSDRNYSTFGPYQNAPFSTTSNDFNSGTAFRTYLAKNTTAVANTGYHFELAMGPNPPSTPQTSNSFKIQIVDTGVTASTSATDFSDTIMVFKTADGNNTTLSNFNDFKVKFEDGTFIATAEDNGGAFVTELNNLNETSGGDNIGFAFNTTTNSTGIATMEYALSKLTIGTTDARIVISVTSDPSQKFFERDIQKATSRRDEFAGDTFPSPATYDVPGGFIAYTSGAAQWGVDTGLSNGVIVGRQLLDNINALGFARSIKKDIEALELEGVTVNIFGINDFEFLASRVGGLVAGYEVRVETGSTTNLVTSFSLSTDTSTSQDAILDSFFEEVDAAGGEASQYKITDPEGNLITTIAFSAPDRTTDNLDELGTSMATIISGLTSIDKPINFNATYDTSTNKLLLTADSQLPSNGLFTFEVDNFDGGTPTADTGNILFSSVTKTEHVNGEQFSLVTGPGTYGLRDITGWSNAGFVEDNADVTEAIAEIQKIFKFYNDFVTFSATTDDGTNSSFAIDFHTTDDIRTIFDYESNGNPGALITGNVTKTGSLGTSFTGAIDGDTLLPTIVSILDPISDITTTHKYLKVDNAAAEGEFLYNTITLSNLLTQIEADLADNWTADTSVSQIYTADSINNVLVPTEILINIDNNNATSGIGDWTFTAFTRDTRGGPLATFYGIRSVTSSSDSLSKDQTKYIWFQIVNSTGNPLNSLYLIITERAPLFDFDELGIPAQHTLIPTYTQDSDRIIDTDITTGTSINNSNVQTEANVPTGATPVEVAGTFYVAVITTTQKDLLRAQAVNLGLAYIADNTSISTPSGDSVVNLDGGTSFEDNGVYRYTTSNTTWTQLV